MHFKPLALALTLLIVTPVSAYAQNAQFVQTSPTVQDGSSRFGGIRLELSPSIPAAGATQVGSTGDGDDMQNACFYAGKRYSEGARLNGQICAHPDDSNGGNSLSTAPPSLRWIPIARYGRTKN